MRTSQALLCSTLIASVLSVSSVCLAQQVSAPPAVSPRPTIPASPSALPAAPASPVSSDPARPSDDALALPLRLSLVSSIAMPGMGAGGLGEPGGCSAPSVNAAGTILPTQMATLVQVTMRLTLVGVSNLGCAGDPYAAFDAGMGGGLNYIVQLPRGFWLAANAGAYAMPSSQQKAAVGGLDLVIKGSDGKSTSVGVGTTSTTRSGKRVMARVGGSF
jgi:hypothetical protein